MPPPLYKGVHMSMHDSSRRKQGEAWDMAGILFDFGGDVMTTIGRGLETGSSSPGPASQSGGQAISGSTAQATSPQKEAQTNTPSVWTTIGSLFKSAGTAAGRIGDRVTGGSAYTGDSYSRPENDPNQPGGNQSMKIMGFSPLWLLALPAGYVALRLGKVI